MCIRLPQARKAFIVMTVTMISWASAPATGAGTIFDNAGSPENEAVLNDILAGLRQVQSDYQNSVIHATVTLQRSERSERSDTSQRDCVFYGNVSSDGRYMRLDETDCTTGQLRYVLTSPNGSISAKADGPEALVTSMQRGAHFDAGQFFEFPYTVGLLEVEEWLREVASDTIQDLLIKKELRNGVNHVTISARFLNADLPKGYDLQIEFEEVGRYVVTQFRIARDSGWIETGTVEYDNVGGRPVLRNATRSEERSGNTTWRQDVEISSVEFGSAQLSLFDPATIGVKQSPVENQYTWLISLACGIGLLLTLYFGLQSSDRKSL